MYLDQTTPNSLITVLPSELDNLDQFLWMKPTKSTFLPPGVKKIPLVAIANSQDLISIGNLIAGALRMSTVGQVRVKEVRVQASPCLS